MNSILDFSSQNFSVYLPESLRVLKEAYLKIEVPQCASAFKTYPGLHFIDKIRILSAGQEVYVCDYHQHLVDYLQQLRDEDGRQFGKTYLGWETVASNAARTIMLPILLPNSPFLLRDGKDLRGHGIFPSYLGQNRLEIQFTMKANTFQSANGTDTVPTISGKCSMMYRECQRHPPTSSLSETREVNTPSSPADSPSSPPGGRTRWPTSTSPGTSTSRRGS